MPLKISWPPKYIKNCTACHLSDTRRNVVHGKGYGCWRKGLLFIGEAPGRTEDALGEPFVGPSGTLFREMLKDSGIKDYYITNSILCRPVDSDGKDRMPISSEVYACKPNVNKIIHLVTPRIICFIGKVSAKYYGKAFQDINKFSIVHPAFVLRNGGRYSYMYLDVVKVLKNIKKQYDLIFQEDK